MSTSHCSSPSVMNSTEEKGSFIYFFKFCIDLQWLWDREIEYIGWALADWAVWAMGTEVGRCMNLLLAAPSPACASLIFAEAAGLSLWPQKQCLSCPGYDQTLTRHSPPDAQLLNRRDRIRWMEIRCDKPHHLSCCWWRDCWWWADPVPTWMPSSTSMLKDSLALP